MLAIHRNGSAKRNQRSALRAEHVEFAKPPIAFGCAKKRNWSMSPGTNCCSIVSAALLGLVMPGPM